LNPTGYARVTDEILRHLDPRFEVHQFGINYRGPHLHAPWQVHPNFTEGDPHGVTCLRRLLPVLAPRIVLIVYDTYLYPLLRRVFAGAGTPKPHVILYSPIEGLTPERIRHVADVGRLVLYHAEARSWIAEAFAQLQRTDPALGPPPLGVIPLGVDTGRFRPLAGGISEAALQAGRRAARLALFPDRPELRDAFIVLNANRNTLRKRVDITLETFARFAADKPDAWLYLHMGMRDVGYAVRDHAAKLGIADRLLVSTTQDAHPQMDDERLNLIYNACDVGLNTSTAEGWGPSSTPRPARPKSFPPTPPAPRCGRGTPSWCLSALQAIVCPTS
jgi:glycosyltransferase involved in cell wall biosynthesis